MDYDSATRILSEQLNICHSCGYSWHLDAAIECPMCDSYDISEDETGCSGGECKL